MKALSRIICLTLLFIFFHTHLPAGLLSLQSTCLGQTFSMEQQAGNSQGVVSRYISICDPWSGAYLNERVTVVGRAEIRDSFSMNNLWPAPGGENDFDLDSVFSSDTIDMNIFNETDHSSNETEKIFNQESKSESGWETNIYRAGDIIINNDQRADMFFNHPAANKYSWLDLF